MTIRLSPTKNITSTEAVSLSDHRVGDGDEHKHIENKLRVVLTGLDVTTLNDEVSMSIDKSNIDEFIPMSVIAHMSSVNGAAATGDIQITMGTTPGGTDIISTTTLTSLIGLNNRFVIKLSGVIATIPAGGTIYCKVVTQDSSAGNGHLSDIYVIGEMIDIYDLESDRMDCQAPYLLLAGDADLVDFIPLYMDCESTQLDLAGEADLNSHITYTSTAGGNYSGAIWDIVGTPGLGDTVIVSDTHDIVVDVDTVVGGSPATLGQAITCIDSGSLTIGTGISLTSYGGILIDESPFTGNAGSTLELVAGAGVLYELESITYGAEDADFVFNGTSENRCTVTASGAGDVRLTTYMSGNNGTDIAASIATYTDFSGLGNATNKAIYTRRGSLSFTNCTFDGCRSIGNTTTYFYPESNIVFNDCNFANKADTYDLYLHNQSVAVVTGTRNIANCAFAGGPQLFYNWGDCNIDGCYVEAWSHSAQAREEDYLNRWQDNFINTNSDFLTKSPTVKDNVRRFPTQDNGHGFVMQDEDIPAITFDGNIFEHGTNWVTDECDCILNSESMTAATTILVQNNIVLPNASDRATGVLFTDNCLYSNVTWTVDKNTFFSDNNGGGQVAAHGTGSAGRIASFRSNLGWSESGPSAATLLFETGDAVPANNYITVADYNAYNYITTAYDVTAAGITGTAGANDTTSIDPQFVDSTRDLASWSETILGNTGTGAQLQTAAINALKAMNNPSSGDYDALATVSGLVTWIKVGLAPQNSALTTSGHDGGRIGAINVV